MLFVARTAKGGMSVDSMLDMSEPELWEWFEAADEVESRIADAINKG
jgi:hypothetical protein